MSSPLSRRAAMLGAGSAAGAIIVGAGALAINVDEARAAEVSEEIGAKVDRLCHELSAALDEFAKGTFRAVIEPDSKSRAPVLLQNMRLARKDDALVGYLKNADPGDLATYHAEGLAKVLRDQRGGFWMVSDIRGIPLPDGKSENNVVMFVQHGEERGYGKSGCGVPAFDFHPIEGGAA